MPYPLYEGPNKPDKGKKHGSCNRTLCQDAPAEWYNHGAFAWYCHSCMKQIYDDWGRRAWLRDFPDAGHPQFETEAMMEARGVTSVHTI